MVFLSWESLKDAEDSLARVDAEYGCPYVAENGYRMDSWSEIRSPDNEVVYGFFKPDARLGRDVADIMDVLVPGYTEKPYRSEDFQGPEDGSG